MWRCEASSESAAGSPGGIRRRLAAWEKDGGTARHGRTDLRIPGIFIHLLFHLENNFQGVHHVRSQESSAGRYDRTEFD